MKHYKDYTKEDLMRLLESLTPGGSEFYQSPITCVDYVNSRKRTAVKLAIKLKEVQKQRDELLKAVI